jgi:hypothetical protein
MRCTFAVYKQFEVSVQKESHCQQMDFQEVEGNSLLKEFADNADFSPWLKCTGYYICCVLE